MGSGQFAGACGVSTYVPAANLYSTAPFLYSALFQLITDAGALQSPYVYVAPFELEQYEPGRYIIVSGFANQRMEIETLGVQSMLETYDIEGCVSVYTGDSPTAESPGPALLTMQQTYALFNETVMSPAMSNRFDPVFGAVSPLINPGSVNMMLPVYVRYSSGPGWMDGGAATGWMGRIDWSFTLRAFITPTSQTVPA